MFECGFDVFVALSTHVFSPWLNQSYALSQSGGEAKPTLQSIFVYLSSFKPPENRLTNT
jgi:hypothetical protein